MASRVPKVGVIAKEEVNTAVRDAQADRALSLNTGEVASRSYELWQERGCPIGSPEVDWFRSGKELRDRHSSAQTAA